MSMVYKFSIIRNVIKSIIFLSYDRPNTIIKLSDNDTIIGYVYSLLIAGFLTSSVITDHGDIQNETTVELLHTTVLRCYDHTL